MSLIPSAPLQAGHTANIFQNDSRVWGGLVIPDLWQQEAVRALQQGKDVVVQAPTGSGKTYIVRAALSEPENSGGVHRPDPRTRFSVSVMLVGAQTDGAE